MKRALVSIISTQTLPNVLFIKQMGARHYDRHYFITTPQMERQGCSANIVRATGIAPASVHKVEVDHDDLTLIQSALDNLSFDHTAIDVHLTGGTKIMAIAVYEFFKSRYPDRCRIFYIPHSTPIILSLHPDTEEVIRLTARVNLYEYLQAYGIRIYMQGAKGELDRNDYYNEARAFLDYIYLNKSIPKKILQASRITYKETDKSYYQGRWFEIFCARFVRDHFRLRDDQFAYQVCLTRDHNNPPQHYTEYDLLYVRENKLYIAECKFFSNKLYFQKSRILKEWYKLGSLKLSMGLNATPFILTANFTSANTLKDIKNALPFFHIRDYADIEVVCSIRKFKEFLDKL